MGNWQDVWVNRFYRSKPGWRDGTEEFHEICGAAIPPNARILEVGAGPTNPTSSFLASLGELHGVDIDGEVTGNVHLVSTGVIEHDRYPFADAHFDVVVSNYVVEHVADPAAHLAEIRRVLKPGGRYVFRTPNLFHYVALISRALSHRAHKLLANRMRDLPTDSHDPYPTVYAMNTPERVDYFGRMNGFVVERMEMVEKEPSYGKYARPMFVAFMAYERLVNATNVLAPLRANMFVVLRAPTATSSS
jgi:SAM-dependent methyltransferase